MTLIKLKGRNRTIYVNPLLVGVVCPHVDVRGNESPDDTTVQIDGEDWVIEANICTVMTALGCPV